MTAEDNETNRLRRQAEARDRERARYINKIWPFIGSMIAEVYPQHAGHVSLETVPHFSEDRLLSIKVFCSCSRTLTLEPSFFDEEVPSL